jgi:hypothetical protein
MNTFKNSKTAPDENLNESEQLEATEISDDGLDSETGLVAGEVSEIAGDSASENKAQGAGQKSQAQAAKKTEVDLADRVALRDRLLATAPKEGVMRGQVRQELLKEKEKLESEVKKYKHNYSMLSEAMAKLRAVVKLLAEVSHASYEALKEIWLRVIHRFA